jgi:hypothetical protein
MGARAIVIWLLILYRQQAGPSGCTICGVGLGRLITGILCSNPVWGIYVRLCFYAVLSCAGWDFCDGLVLSQRSPTKYPNKITKSPLLGGQGACKDCRATDDDDYDDEVCTIANGSREWGRLYQIPPIPNGIVEHLGIVQCKDLSIRKINKISLRHLIFSQHYYNISNIKKLHRSFLWLR